MTPKITAEHLKRAACVYLRQSTMMQLREHQESTERQYQLVDRAGVLGWGPDMVRVLDGDLGKSGTTAEGRDDFHRLCASVGLGEVGAVFALEASRLSRSQADWHRLLDLCAWTHTLLIDHDGVYDPNDFNDRVLLGFKGTWSHTELHAMRLRLHGAQRHKAAKGEFRARPPVGYAYTDGDLLDFDPDEGVVAAVQRVFKLFRSIGSGYGVVRYHAENGLLFPNRMWKGGGRPGALEWVPLRTGRVHSILHNPTYAGAYAYGKRPLRPVVRDGVLMGTRQVSLPRDEWEVLLQDAHPTYITWEEYLENERMLTMNRTWVETGERQGRPRGGEAMLQGLVLCGRCGRRMLVQYTGTGGKRAVYMCRQREPEKAVKKGAACWSVPAKRIDEALVVHVLAAVSEDNLDLSLQILHHLEHEAEDNEREWQLRLERARFEASRAERQYNEVEPENRLVSRTLERRWEEKLSGLDELERAYGDARSKPGLDLTAEQRASILRLARDLPAVWNCRLGAPPHARDPAPR